MKFCDIYIIATFSSLLWLRCSGQQVTAEGFTWKLIENSLNNTSDVQNFLIAPCEAYKLYKEVFDIENESNENDTPDSTQHHVKQTLNTVLPVMRKQQKLLNSQHTNQTDLVSSIALTARWSFNFQSRDTYKRAFHQFGKMDEKIWMDFMRKDDTFYYTHDDRLNASILVLPLHAKEIKLTVILPDQWDALQDVKEYLLENMVDFKGLINRSHRMVLVRVLLPKFHLTYKQDLKEFLEQISCKKLENYENIYQEANLEFNERGIGRFERTTVLFWNAYSYLRVAPEMFDISHPFLFLITDKDGVQFFGQIVQMQMP